MTKQILARLCAILAWASASAWAAGGLPQARDLQKDAEAAHAINGAILIVLTGEHCVFCERVQKNFLVPMSGNKTYQGKVVMRRLVVSDDSAIRGFDGHPTTPRKLAQQYGYTLVPTVVVLDGKGRILAKPVVGLTTEDYYGMYLDEAIDTALAKIRGPAPL
ncbi:MAG: thioredoxin fold domain-containing protein [Thiobacillus sp.]|nr:thioredoxin fold domain-containing protein [Thiobacillus sp.]